MTKYIFSFFAVFFLQSCGKEREQFIVKKSDLVESVYSSVILEPAEIFKVNSLYSGFISEIPFETGDLVEENVILFKISDVAGLNNMDNARLNLELAQSKFSGKANILEEMRLELKSALLKMRNDSLQYERVYKLYKNGASSKSEFEMVELAYDVSKNNVDGLTKKIARTERELKASIEQAENNLESSTSNFELSLIRNKLDGKVYDIFKDPGELVIMQEPLAIIGSKDKFVLIMLIDEVDITRVKTGQKITVFLEAYGQRVFEAKVTRISPKMDEKTMTFEIEGEFVNPPDNLFMGLTGEANIIIDTKENVIVIPREYLVGENQVETGDGFVTVKTGIKSISHVEIVSGLKEKTIILKPL